MSEDNNENLYYYSNKGKQQTFNLDDLTTEELKKFEKMTERQRLKFITNFELQRDTPFQDAISLRPIMTEARNEKYGDYALLKAKLDEVEKILDKDKDYENYEKLSLLDDDGNIIPEYLEDMNFITEDDLKNCMKAFDLKDVSLGMLKKYYNRKIESIELPGIKTSFLEALKKFYKELYKKDIDDKKDDVLPRHINYSFTKFNETLNTPASLTTAMENTMVDANKEMKNEIINIVKPMKINKKDELMQAIKDYDWDKVSKFSITLNLSQVQDFIRNYNILQEMLNEMYNPPHKDVSTPLALPMNESKTSVKVEEVPEEKVEENEEKKEETKEIPEEKKEEKVEGKEEIPEEKKEVVNTIEERKDIDITSPARKYDARKNKELEEQFVKEFVDTMGLMKKIKETSVKNLTGNGWELSPNVKDKFVLTLEDPVDKKVYQIIKDKNGDTTYTFYEYKNVKQTKNGEYKYGGPMKQPYLLKYKAAKDQYETIIYNNGDPKIVSRKFTYVPNNDKMFTAEYGKNKANLTFTEYGEGYKIKYTSGSIIDKIRSKFLKNVEKSIDDLEKEDKNIYSKLDSLESQIREIKDSLKSMENSKKEKEIPIPPPPPISKPSNFLDEIKNPHKPLNPVKPGIKPAPQEEYSDIKKILDERRKDIEYSDDEDEDIEWGEGIKSKHSKRMEILEFLKSLD
jgi:peptidoglycan hydrolase CwlO-like protein